MNKNQNEQNRITLSIAFIATYLTIILGISEKIKVPSSDFNIINDLAFNIFIFNGVIVVLLFFLYLAFTALELDFHKSKEVMFDQEVSKEKIHQIRKSLYNGGIYWIFISFTYPVYYLFGIFLAVYGLWWSLLLMVFCLALIYILLYIIFRDKKSN